MRTTRGSARRPTRAELVPLIKETGGNVTRLASRLGTTRQTLYTWIYQLDLADLVGIRTKDQQEADVMREDRTARAERRTSGLPSPGRPPGPGKVSVSARVDPSLWRALRIRGIEEDRSTSELLEDAVRAYLAQERRP